MIRLFGPLLYLRVWHFTKFIIDIVVPAAFTFVFMALTAVLDIDVAVLGPDGIVTSSLPLLGALSGFYIAALTAISAFTGERLDAAMPGDKICWHGGGQNPSRRQFLSLQFGYLAYIAIILFCIGIFGGVLSQNITLPQIEVFSFRLDIAAGNAFLLLAVLMIFNLVSVTIFSIYYLAIKLHEDENTLSGGPS